MTQVDFLINQKGRASKTLSFLFCLSGTLPSSLNASRSVLSPNFRVFRVTIFIIYHFSFIIYPCASLSHIFFIVLIRRV